MAYTPQTWSDGQVGNTPINATRLTHIESGLQAAAAAADSTAIIQVGTTPPNDATPGKFYIQRVTA